MLSPRGKKAAIMIDRYVRGEDLRQPEKPKIPKIYIEPLQVSSEETTPKSRVELPRIPVKRRSKSFIEVERAMSEADAEHEALRCMRCDLEFTRPLQKAVNS